MNNPYKQRVRDCIENAMQRAFLPKRKIGSMLMLSGGLDSVALLANLLEFTDHDVHAHHVEIRNTEARADVENAALEKTLDYLRRNYRDFRYTSSKYELMLGLGGGLDMTLVLFMAARVDTASGGGHDLVWTGHLSGTTVYDMAESAAVFTACYTNRRVKPIWLTPYRMSNKLDIYMSIPRELLDMTWSCRTPQRDGPGYKACGSCHACMTREETLAKLPRPVA